MSPLQMGMPVPATLWGYPALLWTMGSNLATPGSRNGWQKSRKKSTFSAGGLRALPRGNPSKVPFLAILAIFRHFSQNWPDSGQNSGYFSRNFIKMAKIPRHSGAFSDHFWPNTGCTISDHVFKTGQTRAYTGDSESRKCKTYFYSSHMGGP